MGGVLGGRALWGEVAPRPAVVLFDPDYQGTTGGYAGSLSRAEVLRVAAAWRDAGALIAVCEQEPLQPAGRWWHVDLRYQRGQQELFPGAAGA